ncbi:MAG: type I-E CRISPR-associated protein Cas6/Cse3/CasE [Leptospiraceae bacterium]|nr:type I-E CRISPR-associated protein Cas6/Cse3/CasE [Leptospiraceae bacterium]
MYLTKLDLDMQKRKTANWLQNPYNIHKRLWMAFPAEKHKHNDPPPFLYRLELQSQTRILVQSKNKPSWQLAFKDFDILLNLPKEEEDVKEIKTDNFLESGSVFRFSLIANPTKKVKDYRSLFQKELKDYPETWTHANHTKYLEGKRILEDLKKSVSKEQREKLKSKKIGIYNKEEQIQWLSNRGKEGGFELIEVNHIPSVIQHEDAFERIKKDKETKSIQVYTVHFTGILRVTNQDAFKHTYTYGIGSAKAFGCGMLMIAR